VARIADGAADTGSTNQKGLAMTPNTPPSSDALPTPGPADPAQALRIHEGDCWAFFAFDVGYAIDLDAAETSLAAEHADTASPPSSPRSPRPPQRDQLPHAPGRRRAPASMQFRPAPLRVDQPAPDPAGIPLGGFAPAGHVECTLFDFGGVSVAYRIPLDGRGKGGGGGDEAGPTLDSLLPLAQALFDCPLLRDDAARRVAALVARLGDAIDRPNVSSIVEDYTVYHARRWSAGPASAPVREAEAAVAGNRDALARLLLAEPGPDEDRALSAKTVESALSSRLSYSAADAAVIDWNAAIILGHDEADALAVLEFINVELLEMRFLDDRLDAMLDRSYATLLRRDERGKPPPIFRSPMGVIFDPHRSERRRVAALAMESAVLFEGVNNALKLVGDQHLSRLYAAAAGRFHMAEWDRSILRKLHTIEGLYQKLADEQANRRMEVLEWIIIILIAVSIVLPFLPGVAGIGK
jgi:hypothetical protein